MEMICWGIFHIWQATGEAAVELHHNNEEAYSAACWVPPSKNVHKALFWSCFFFCSAQLDLNFQCRLLTFFHDLVRRFVVFLFNKTKEMAGFFQKKHLQALPCRGIASSWAATVVNCKSGMLHLQSCWALPRCNGSWKKMRNFSLGIGWVGWVGLVHFSTWDMMGCIYIYSFFSVWIYPLWLLIWETCFSRWWNEIPEKKSGLRSSFVFSFMETTTRNPWQSTT